MARAVELSSSIDGDYGQHRSSSSSRGSAAVRAGVAGAAAALVRWLESHIVIGTRTDKVNSAPECCNGWSVGSQDGGYSVTLSAIHQQDKHNHMAKDGHQHVWY